MSHLAIFRGFCYLSDPEWHSGRISGMAEPQLSVRSAKARDLARRLARREHRSIADVVERALEAYEIREAGREPASAFLRASCQRLRQRSRSGGRHSRKPEDPSRTGALTFLDTNVIS